MGQDDQIKADLGHASGCDPFLRRVQIENYKSIDKCDVELGQLTTLVGRNGAGKSNFLDALRFVTDSLDQSLGHAIRSRGGIDQVRRRSTGHPRNFAIKLSLDLPHWSVATYGFQVAARPKGGFIVKSEVLEVRDSTNQKTAHYHVKEGKIVSTSHDVMPPAVEDRLLLVRASDVEPLRLVYDSLLSMGFYNMNPEVMKLPQKPDSGELLHRDGANIASVVSRLETDEKLVKDRINEYLEKIVPGITGAKRVPIMQHETLEFYQNVQGASAPWRFFASSMSDGTLRALGSLVAIMQLTGTKKPVSFVGIEEPETALHPGATAVLMDALREASMKTQILITTHSPDLIEQFQVANDTLLVVVASEGKSSIARVSPTNRKTIEQHLYSAGELLRMDQLEPDRDDLIRQKNSQFRLFPSNGGSP